ncbi:MAG: YicC family protein [Oscillibacter sp.]|nr:YicC family protein [Oscillibacter sp.]
MIRSMTGYGRAGQVRNRREITIELRSVNNRYLDCTIKMHHLYLFAEDALKKKVQRSVSRGKVDVFVTVDASAADTVRATVNRELAAQYAAALRELSEIAGTDLSGQLLTRFPDALTVTKDESDLAAVTEDLCAVLDEALEAFQAMRAAEGVKLAEDIAARLDTVERLTGEIEARSPETVREYRERLFRRMREVLEDSTVDEQRIVMEAALYADKVAVDEETVRLRSHVSQLRQMLASNAPQGRRMDFLIQELNREANTIGSKCADTAIARMVVDLKAEIEKIREQTQNIE